MVAPYLTGSDIIRVAAEAAIPEMEAKDRELE